jgi:hypothetical protein
MAIVSSCLVSRGLGRETGHVHFGSPLSYPKLLVASISFIDGHRGKTSLIGKRRYSADLGLVKIPARHRKAPQQMTMIHQPLGNHMLDAAFGLPYAINGQQSRAQSFAAVFLNKLVP